MASSARTTRLHTLIASRPQASCGHAAVRHASQAPIQRPNAAANAAATGTSTPPTPASARGLLFASLLGGCVALGGVYAFYQSSGAKAVVDGARSAMGTASKVKDKVAEVAPHSPREAARLARNAIGDAAPKVTDAVKHVRDRVRSLLANQDEHNGRAPTHTPPSEDASSGKGLTRAG